ncbi:MAG: M28 family peptidase [Nannocystaceae bacterium]|nr:M28 family peptidase [Nannocystaceae bacterium]
MGTLAGEDGALLVVLGAHFDSVQNSPDAADNATGVAVVLGLAPHS